jgi:hypothetical protein
MDLIPETLIVMTRTHVLKILAILKLVAASTKESLVMITTHVPETLAIWRLESASTLQFLVPMEINVPKKAVMQLKDASTLLNMILINCNKTTNATPMLVTVLPEN